MSMSIRGIQEAQRDNLRTIAALKPNGAFGRAIQWATIQAQRYAVSITHVDTGSLRASHRIEIKGLKGRIYIDPSSINPKSHSLPSRYGLYEHNRGGAHAFYERTADEAGPGIARAAAAGFLQDLP